MGGNATGTIKSTGQTTKAEKIDLLKADRTRFINTFANLFQELNKIYTRKFKTHLWVDGTDFASPQLYNGSTSYIFDTEIPDEELLKYKKSAGDIDIIVPEEAKENLWKMLDDIEGLEVIPNVKYMGNNKPTLSSIGDQINSVFIADFPDYKVPVQVDFEFLEFDSNTGNPTQWAKFSHSSSFEDAQKDVKALHHKYLIQSIIGSASARPDIAIVTTKSTPEKYTISQAKGLDIPRMLKFSVGRGVRIAYEPLMKDNKILRDTETGKLLYKEIPSAKSDYITIIKDIYILAMNDPIAHPEDVKKFWSFVGVIELIKKYIKDQDVIKNTFKRYSEKLFSSKGEVGQIIEVGNPELDFQVKISGYNYMIKEFPFLKYNKELIDTYYEKFSTLRGGTLRESFLTYFNRKKLEKLYEVKEINKNEFTKDDIISILKELNFNEISEKTKTTIIAKTDEPRREKIKQLVNELNGEKVNSSYSSEGAIKVGNIFIVVKPFSKVKGSGGKDFEIDFSEDLKKYYESEKTATGLEYQYEVEEVFKIIGDARIKGEGIKITAGNNSKRKILISDVVTVSPNDGKTISDISIETDKGTFYLSLKIGKSYALYNGGVSPIMQNTEKRRDLLASLGADYKQFEEGFNIKDDSSYTGKVNSTSESENFLDSFISSSIGHDYILVHSNGENSIVSEVKKIQDIKCKILEYKYPIPNKRKYFAIDLEVNLFNHKVKAQFQLRNNLGKEFPNVIYLYEAKKITPELSKNPEEN